MPQYLLALDQGTTSSRALLFDSRLQLCAQAQRELPSYYPQEGWVEQDPMELWSGQYAVMQELLERNALAPQQIAAIGITNQRETTLIWERDTGMPIYNAIVWQCRRSAPLVDALRAQGLTEHIQSRCGLVPDAYFSASKIRWLLDAVPGAQQRAEAGELCFGTVDTWLLWKLTGGQVHATDYTNASRTMLFDIHTLDWDERLLSALQIPRALLPSVRPSGSIFGEATLSGVRVPIAALLGDQQAALFGQGCTHAGEAKNTYGTGCFLLMHTGDTAVRSQNGLLTTLAASLDTRPQYALEGSVFSGGAVIQWLRDELGLIRESREVEALAASVPDTGGAYLVPAFTGLGAPHWDMYARACLVGMTRGTGRAQIVRAAQEAIAYQVADLLDAMERDAGFPLKTLRADGGASRDSFLLQFQADIIARPVERPLVRESTALGAAFLAGLVVGLFSSTDTLQHLNPIERRFSPHMPASQREALLHGWQRALSHAKAWAE